MFSFLKNYKLHSIFYKVQKHTRENSKLFRDAHEENCVLREKEGKMEGSPKKKEGICIELIHFTVQ